MTNDNFDKDLRTFVDETKTSMNAHLTLDEDAKKYAFSATWQKYHMSWQSRGRVFTSVCLCVSVLQHDISKIDAARIAKLDIKMFRDKC